MARNSAIAALMVFIALTTTFLVCTHPSIQSVRGPGLRALAEVIIFDAFLLFVIYSLLRETLRRRLVWQALIAFVFAAGVGLFVWQSIYTKRVLAEAQSVVVETFPDLKPRPFLQEVCVTRDGLVFWCWFTTGTPEAKRPDFESLAQRKVEERLRARFPEIKRVVEVRF